MPSRFRSRKRQLLAAVAVLVAGLWLSTRDTQGFASRYVDNSCANNGNGMAVGCAASPGGPGAYNLRGGAATDWRCGGGGPDKLGGGGGRDVCRGAGGLDTQKHCEIARGIP